MSGVSFSSQYPSHSPGTSLPPVNLKFFDELTDRLHKLNGVQRIEPHSSVTTTRTPSPVCSPPQEPSSPRTRTGSDLEEKSLPLKKNIPYYVLVESMGSDQVKDEEHFESLLQKALEDSVIIDAVLAKSEKERKALWSFRDDVEKQAQYGPTVMFDVSLPIGEMEEYVSKVDLNLQKHWKDFRHIVWGHLADGNLHLVVGTGDLESDTIKKIENSVYEPLELIGGSISAEHGIGLEKKPYLHLSRSEEEINYMKALKDTFDPKGILNPGLIF